MLNSALLTFQCKFEHFRQHIGAMDSLFEATFSPLAATGKNMSKCGRCSRYMRYIPMRPQVKFIVCSARYRGLIGILSCCHGLFNTILATLFHCPEHFAFCMHSASTVPLVRRRTHSLRTALSSCTRSSSVPSISSSWCCSRWETQRRRRVSRTRCARAAITSLPCS